MEYFLKNDLLAHLEYLSEADRPYGIKCALVRPSLALGGRIGGRGKLADHA